MILRINPTRVMRWTAVLCIAAAASTAMAADAFPNRPVRVFVNTVPGGLVDVVARLVAQKMGEQLGQSVVVENRAGGDGLVGIRALKASPADGHTLLVSAGTIAIQPFVKQDPGYDFLKDFTGVGLIVRSPVMLTVGNSQPDKSILDFVARAKANPGKMSYASAGVGTTTHLGAAKFLHQLGLDLLHVPYKGNAAAMPDVISGRVDMIFESYGSGASKVKSGMLRALGVSSTERLPALPEVPTFGESVAPGFSYYLWVGMLASSGTPKAAIDRLSAALRAALSNDEIRARFAAEGTEAVLTTPAQFNQFLREDSTQMQKLVTELGVPKQ